MITRPVDLLLGRSMSIAATKMNEVVQVGFRGIVRALEAEPRAMLLSRWNESVLRYHFCRAIAAVHPEVEQFVECDRLDLVLVQAPLRGFIEFKFYARPLRFDAYGRGQRGFKGGPSQKNLGEFEACIDQLHARESVPGLSKYIVLVYADPKGDSRPRLTYAKHYDDYKHPRDEFRIRLMEASPEIPATDVVVRAKLYEVGAAQQCNGRTTVGMETRR